MSNVMRNAGQKRHLSEQQKKRISDSQTQQLTHDGLVIAQRRTSVKVLLDGQVHKAVRRANLPDIVVGDMVVCESVQGRKRIVSRGERRNAFCGVVRESNKTFAANIDVLVFVCAPVPQFDIALLEQALLASCAAGIDIIIVCNKHDLLKSTDSRALEGMLALHQGYGRTILYTSALNQNYAPLANTLKHGTALLFGQSGVGKSALLNCLFPGADTATQTLSTRTQLGQHTTSVAHLYFKDDMRVIDCPGVRMLTAPPEGFGSVCVQSAYPDVGALARTCRFRNCAHDRDEGCAVQAAYIKKPTMQLERFLALGSTS